MKDPTSFLLVHSLRKDPPLYEWDDDDVHRKICTDFFHLIHKTKEIPGRVSKTEVDGSVKSWHYSPHLEGKVSSNIPRGIKQRLMVNFKKNRKTLMENQSGWDSPFSCVRTPSYCEKVRLALLLKFHGEYFSFPLTGVTGEKVPHSERDGDDVVWVFPRLRLLKICVKDFLNELNRKGEKGYQLMFVVLVDNKLVPNFEREFEIFTDNGTKQQKRKAQGKSNNQQPKRKAQGESNNQQPKRKAQGESNNQQPKRKAQGPLMGGAISSHYQPLPLPPLEFDLLLESLPLMEGTPFRDLRIDSQ